MRHLPKKRCKNRVENAAAYICGKTDLAPSMGLVLGSGLGSFADTLEDSISIPFGEMPGFPVPTVAGHAGALVIGWHGGKLVVALSGRVHYYEGGTMQELTIPVRAMRLLGVKTLMLTNAAGGVNLDFSAGA